MMNTAIIRIESSMLNGNLKRNLLTALRKEKEMSCVRSAGYTTRIHSISQIISAWIDPADGSNRFHVQFEFDSFKPEIGTIHDAKVLVSYPEGVIVEIEGCCQAFVAEHQENGRPTLRVCITEVEFVGGRFQCVAEVVNQNTGVNGQPSFSNSAEHTLS